MTRTVTYKPTRKLKAAKNVLLCSKPFWSCLCDRLEKDKKGFYALVESDQLRNIVTATIATLGLESFNADTGNNYRDMSKMLSLDTILVN